MKRRVLLKISGEALSPSFGTGKEEGDDQPADADSDDEQSLVKGIGARQLLRVSSQVKTVMETGELDIAIVVGGGNFLRGQEMAEQGVERATADYMGMLATIINGLALQSSLESLGVETRVLSAINVDDVAEPFIRRRALRHLDRGRVVIFAGGTGSPYFSTDSAAALRAVEIGAQCLLKATKVDGIYSENPDENPSAELYDEITFTKVLEKDLKVMDATAVSLCRENSLPIIVFNMTEGENIKKALEGERLGTLVRG